MKLIRQLPLLGALLLCVVVTLGGCSNEQPPVVNYNFPTYDGKATPQFTEILLDNSGSMDGEPLKEAKEAIAEFVLNAPPELALGLVTFDGEIVPIAHNNRQSIMNALSGIEASGGTPLTEYVQLSSQKLSEQMERSFGYGQFNLLVVTDGEAADKESLARAVQEMSEERVYGAPKLLSTIGFKLSQEHSLKKASGERYYEAQDKAGLVAALKKATGSELESLESLLGF